MISIIGSLLKKAGNQIFDGVLQEANPSQVIKDTVKNKVFYSIKINSMEHSTLYKHMSEYLMKNYREKFKSLTANIYRVYTKDNEETDIKIKEDSGRSKHSFRADSGRQSSPKVNYGTSEYRIQYDIEEGRIIIEEEGVYIFVSKSKPEQKDPEGYEIPQADIVLSTLRKNQDQLNAFLERIMIIANTKKSESEEITTYTWDNNYWCQYRTFVPMSIDDIILPQEQKDRILNDLDKFLTKKSWYQRKGATFKRGYLFSGPAGNGKSSLILGIARRTRRDVYYVNLNGMPDESALIRAFRNIPSNSIIVIEDIDAVWDGRKIISNKCNIPFSTFLNLLSGPLEKDDILLFFTSNYPERLDSALTRHRRVDVKEEVSNPTIVEAKKYLETLYEKPFKLDRYVEGRSMSALFNLYEDYEYNQQALEHLLNNQADNKSE